MDIEMDDKDFYVVRKNLNILSVLILILAFTNAKIETLNFLGIQIDLDGSRLYTALFIGYVYLLWRFLTKLPLKSGFLNDFSQYYINSDEGVKKQHHFTRYKDQLTGKSPELKTAVETDLNQRLVQTSVTRFDPREFWNLRLSFTFYVTPKAPGQLSNLTVDQDIVVSRFYFFKCLIVFCVQYDKFGDYLFPLVPVLLNFFFFFTKSEWQGSFKSLVS
ncbi:MAG: hypothetical protein AABY93_08355 [Bacteroidota bacterium]